MTAAFPNRRLFVAGLLAGLSSCKRTPSLPVYNTVPPFRLTAQNGLPFDSQSLRGRPWLASFFFTTCPGPCPRLNTALHDLQEKTYGFPGLKMVSFSIDPERDTPEVLAAYAKRYKADPNRWVFLTGPMDVIDGLSRQAFQVGGLDSSRTHSTRVMLVDGEGRVRGHFASDDDPTFSALISALKDLYN